ncbi:hypothetical protein EVAR_4222_1 [Eumeta japonica]|uniref:Uncharacterized protein n=1 Tax=Eumeta variegata TaxID=151549 RepID=A0A4C1TG51_EUMVA|nr:hypothetical protein EVAR_4222_1 [Eumeta japonica]
MPGAIPHRRFRKQTRRHSTCDEYSHTRGVSERRNTKGENRSENESDRQATSCAELRTAGREMFTCGYRELAAGQSTASLRWADDL